MASNFVFKKTLTTNMKIAGILDVENMTVDIDGEEEKLSTLLSPFEGSCIEINVKVKSEEELDKPVDFDEDDE